MMRGPGEVVRLSALLVALAAGCLGELQGGAGSPELAPDAASPSRDAGGGTTCLPSGRGCVTAETCCSQLCSNGICQSAPLTGVQGAPCTSASDCVANLTCVDDADGGRTCQPVTCTQAGQACTTASTCCSGLFCADAKENPCEHVSGSNCVCTFQR